MKLIALGNNGPYPSANGACSSYLINVNNKNIVFDIGNGTLARLLKIIDPCNIYALIISHWHADHCSDLFTLAYYYQFNLPENKKIKLYSVNDASSFLCKEAIKLKCFEFIEIDEESKIIVDDINIIAHNVVHPVKGLMFRLNYLNSSIIYTGDTNYFNGIEDFCKNADILISDTAFLYRNWNNQMPHLCAKLVAEIAKTANVKKLLLTHIPPNTSENELLEEARSIFKNVEIIKTEFVYEL